MHMELAKLVPQKLANSGKLVPSKRTNLAERVYASLANSKLLFFLRHTTTNFLFSNQIGTRTLVCTSVSSNVALLCLIDDVGQMMADLADVGHVEE